jgi:hypothetical protein
LASLAIVDQTPGKRKVLLSPSWIFSLLRSLILFNYDLHQTLVKIIWAS